MINLRKPQAYIPLALIVLFLLFAGILAVTQESGDETAGNDYTPDDGAFGFVMPEDDPEAEPLPLWIPPGPPRWFRSNAGGMALEETPSRLAALRNAYALVLDYVSPDELHDRLRQHYRDDYTIEIRTLYEQGDESRRQWQFIDAMGNTRLNAVFRPGSVPQPDTDDASERERSGFIELYNEQGRITGDYTFFEDGGEILTEFFYSATGSVSVLVRAETRMKNPLDDAGVYHAMHTDTFRYNRAQSLRSVERLYHAQAEAEPVTLIFPSRMLDAASDMGFMANKLTLGSDFFGDYSVVEGFRIVYDTDSRGRILTQSMIDDSEQVVWTITNTWSGDRITAILKTEGDAEWLTEYEYDKDGNRVIQRDIRDGVMERQIHTEGENETEELYLNGVVVLRAYWENGRKVREERVRH